VKKYVVFYEYVVFFFFHKKGDLGWMIRGSMVSVLFLFHLFIKLETLFSTM